MNTMSVKKVSMLVAAAFAMPPVFAAGITLTDTPFVTEGSISVRSNLMFILDNSGSMAWDFLPDWVSTNQAGSPPSYCKGTSGKVDGISTLQGAAGVTAMHCCLQSDGTATDDNCLNNASTMQYPLPPFLSSDFNAIYYNPTITYEIPKKYDGSLMATPSFTLADRNGFNSSTTDTVNLSSGLNEIAWCSDTGLTDCLRNGDYVLPGTVSGTLYQYPKMVKATGTASVATSPTTIESGRSIGAHYYVIVPGAYCTTKKLTNCSTRWGKDSVWKFPARLRWCNSAELKTTDDPATTSVKESCQALKTANHKYPLYPGVMIKDGSAKARILIDSVTRNTTVNISDLKVGNSSGPDLVQTNISYYTNSSSSTTRRNGLRDQMVARINASGTGFTAIATDTGEFEVSAPAGTTYNNASFFPNVTGGSFSWNASSAKFDNSGGTPERAPGKWHRIDLTGSGTFGSLYVNTTTGAVSTTGGTGKYQFLDKTTRKDCSAGNCDADKERQNFANWWTYYSTRMQMMKSAVALSFQTIDDKVRTGYFTINNADMSSNTSVAGGLNIDDFDTAWKQKWYEKILKEGASGGTPLRAALSYAGRMYGGILSDISNMKDPVQYSCQKNFTILSTDGYWNGSGGIKLDGSAIGSDIDGDGTDATLADIAQYYYTTDLRGAPGTSCNNPASNNIGGTGTSGANFTNLCDKDDVPPSPPDDNNTKQHMVVSTIGLGIDGVMQHRKNYTQTPSSDDLPDDYQAVVSQSGADPAQGICSWQTSGACKWPVAGTNKQENIDDLWHAAVNSKGTYEKATNPNELRESIESLLMKIKATTGAAAAATTSNPNVTTGDNFVFSSSFRTVDWYGELVRQAMDPSSGVISPTIDWSLQQKMDAVGERSGTNGVFTFDKDATDGRKAFTYSGLNSTDDAKCAPPVDEKGCFNAPRISTWSQWGSLNTTQQTDAAGNNLVSFLKGDTAFEGTLYRNREHTLGDIVSSEAIYLGRYLYSYDSSWYPSNGTARAHQTVFLAANDGMLHAVDANSGNPRWSYMPSMVLPNLYKLADTSYKTNHRYFIDGSPVAGDINYGGLKTILVTGLAGGGPGYFALDVSDPATPKALWEFRKRDAASCVTDPGIQRVGKVIYDCDLGHSFGNPVVAKVNGTWVVMVTSGYNNHTDGGDGKGYLYILNAYTGEPVGPKKISTLTGDTTTPSGLSKIAAWADNAMTENIVQYVYGGDYLGNLWRFDVVNGGTPKKLKSFPNQPITAKPELGVVTGGGKEKYVVFLPTGSLIGANDLSNTDQQSFYAIWDAERNNMTVPSTLVNQPITGGATSDHSSTACNSVFDDHNNLGWKIDFPVAKERGTSDPTLVFGTLVFSTNAPVSTSVCNPSGFESWVWNIDYQCGGTVTTVSGSTTVAATHYTGMSTRPNVVVLPSGTVKSITRVSGEKVENMVTEVRISGKAGPLRKISWRELTK